MRILIAITGAMFSWGTASADSAPAVNFKSLARITMSNLLVDGTKAAALNCEGYGHAENEGIKIRFKSTMGLEYGLDCRGQEVGNRFDLIVSKDGLKVTSADSVASSGSDCGLIGEQQSWLDDLNGDGFLDLVKRSKSKTVASDCANTANANLQDKVEVFHWNSGGQAFVEAKLSAAETKKFKKKYDFVVVGPKKK